MMRRRVVLLLFGVALHSAASAVHAQTEDQCRAVLAELRPGVAAGRLPCRSLATLVHAEARSIQEAVDIFLSDEEASVGSVYSQRDLQARHTQQPALAGTPAQGQAIPSVQPAGVAAGTIAAVGTDAGNEAIAALGLNPVILFIGEEVSRQLARYSRFADLTVFLPVSQLETQQTGTSQPAKKLEYYGARLRLNVTGVSSGDKVWSGARRLVENWMRRADRNITRVREAFRTAPDLKSCVQTVLETADAARITAACGAPVSLEVDLVEAEQLKRELTAVRNAADSRYFGADLRVDVGDPTLGTVANASGVFTFAGLAFGRRLSGAGEGHPTYGLRSRLGVRHAKLDSVSTAEFAAEGGLGFEFARMIDQEEINGSLAVEFREGNTSATLVDQFQTNFVMFRASLVLPVTAGNSVSINVGVPVRGDVSRILSVNFNWGLLFPDVRRR